jgi:hypothetical protein
MGLRTSCALIAALLAALQAIAAATMFPVPPGARQPSHVVLQRGSAERDYFWLKAAYPATPALDHYTKLFAEWLPCKPREQSWRSFGDDQKGLFFHQLTRHWVSPDNKQAVSVLFQYTSPGSKPRSSPDSDNQFVSVMRHRVPDATAFFAETEVECPKAPGQ